MPDPIHVTIGGEPVELPLVLTFAGLERVWPAVRAMAATRDPVEQVAAAIGIVSGALLMQRPELTVPEIKARLRVGAADERTGLLKAVDALLVASGLVPAGEVSAPAPPAPE